MVDEKQIKKWLNEGTINQAQAKKMLSDSSLDKSAEKSNKFITIIATIGAVLIFIGIAWLIAKNWHQIPDLIKVFILVLATVAAFVFGVFLRQKKHEGVGRSLLVLGALLYILSVFLIAQIYNVSIEIQGYAWLLFFCWPIIILIAYFLDSKENLVISMIVFLIWITVQYVASVLSSHFISDSGFGIILAFVLMYLSVGALLYGVSAFHSSIKHSFADVYRFWTVFYFFIIFYILSFQAMLTVLNNYTFDPNAFPVFLVLLIIICLFGFLVGLLFSASKASKHSVSIKEIGGFIGILAMLLIMIVLTKMGEGSVGFFGFNSHLSTALWLLWIFNNFVFIGFIVLMIWYGQKYNSTKIINLALFAFILEIISRYIGFWMNLEGYFAFSVLAIVGGLMLIFGALYIPKLRKKLLEDTSKQTVLHHTVSHH